MGLAVLLLLGCGDDTNTGDGATDTGGPGSSSGDASSGDASSGSGGGGSGAADVCTSKQFWTMGELESPLMHPGRACLTCHATVVGEDVKDMFAIAGTVFPSLHEVDDCDGASGAGLQVVITTADDQVLTLPVNAAGNFMYDQLELGPVAFPIHARVVRGDLEVAMATPQMTGDCNSCHTEQGTNGAPGRILSP